MVDALLLSLTLFLLKGPRELAKIAKIHWRSPPQTISAATYTSRRAATFRITVCKMNAA
jgi:hypothetical protein